MYKPLLGKMLADLRAQILAWGLGMGSLLVLTVLVYPSISSSYSDIMRELPEGLTAFLGGDFSVESLEGYLNAEFIMYAPMALGVFAIIAGTGSIVSEENQETLDILLAQPLPRLRLILIKMTALIMGNGVVVAILLAMFWLTIPFVDIEVKAGRLIAALTLLWPFLTTISFLSLALSLVLPGRAFAGTVMAGLLVISFVLGSLANLVSWLEPLRPIYLMSYYQGSNSLLSEISWSYTIGLIGIMAMAMFLSVWLFLRREIAVQRPIGFMFIRKAVSHMVTRRRD